MDLQIENRFWIKSDKGTVMGEGRATLIEFIDETGSIEAAASKMDMPLEKALKLVDIMNTAAPEKMLEVSGESALVTDFGRSLTKAYRKIQAESASQMQESLSEKMK